LLEKKREIDPWQLRDLEASSGYPRADLTPLSPCRIATLARFFDLSFDMHYRPASVHSLYLPVGPVFVGFPNRREHCLPVCFLLLLSHPENE
jgi:hypothetical protein